MLKPARPEIRYSVVNSRSNGGGAAAVVVRTVSGVTDMALEDLDHSAWAYARFALNDDQAWATACALYPGNDGCDEHRPFMPILGVESTYGEEPGVKKAYFLKRGLPPSAGDAARLMACLKSAHAVITPMWLGGKPVNVVFDD